MSNTNRKWSPSGAYDVGYARPPAATRFRRGQSGNPRGRPRGSSRNRARELILQEAYRRVTVRGR